MLVCIAGCSEEGTQTVVRFVSSSQLDVPTGATLSVTAYRSDERQHEAGTDLGTFPFKENIAVVVTADGGDASRRFTLFAELRDAQARRLSWTRVRTGHIKDQLAAVRVEFAKDCLSPSDRLPLPDDYDELLACGSHDTCVQDTDGGRCATACVGAVANETFGSEVSPQELCPSSDSLPVDFLDAGWAQTCALASGEAFCWGRPSFAVHRPDRYFSPSRILSTEGLSLPTADPVVDVSVFLHQSVVVYESGALAAGGRRIENGEYLGVTPPSREGPDDTPCCALEPPVSAGFISAIAGRGYTCGVTKDLGEVFCTGNPPGPQQTSMTYTKIPDLNGFDRLYGAWLHLGGYKTDGSFEWIGNQSSVAAEPVPDRDQILDASAGTKAFCVVTVAGELKCWGRSTANDSYDPQPQMVGSARDWKRIALAEFDVSSEIDDKPHACGVKDDGRLFCWGSNDSNRLGADSSISSAPDDAPLQVGPDSDWVDVVVGRAHTCGIRSGGRVYCFGKNDEYQLGRAGSGSQEPVEVLIPGW